MVSSYRKWILVFNIAFFLLLALFSSRRLLASQGVLTMTKGHVEIYTEPQVQPQGVGPFVLFNDQHYRLKQGKIGTKVGVRDVVHTGPNGKARIVFPDGDQFIVGPATTYRLTSKDGEAGQKKSAPPVLDLMYGRIRSVISKSGPRNRLKIKTPTAVAGVRGTDFYIRHSPSEKRSKISVLRGYVEVKPRKSKSKPVLIEKGFHARIEAMEKDKKKIPKVRLERASQQDLIGIQSETFIKNDPSELESLNPDVKESIAKLEEKAAITTLTDIKTYDPQLYEKMVSQGAKTVSEVNSAVVSDLYHSAPVDEKKPSLLELQNLDEDVYERYFKIDKK